MPLFQNVIIDFHGIHGKIHIPLEWKSYIDIVFRDILTKNAAGTSFTIQCSRASKSEEGQYLHLREKSGVDSKHILVWRKANEIIHMTSSCFFSYNQKSQSGEFKLYSKDPRSIFFQTNFLLRYFIWEAASRGILPLHAAAIGKNHRCVLIPGSAASGKSTLAMVGFLEGFDVPADDFCFLKPEEKVFKIQGIYNTCRISTDSIGLISRHYDLSSIEKIYQRGDGKVIFFLKKETGNISNKRGNLAAIVIPEICGADKCRLIRIKPSEALKGFASTLKLIAYNGGDVKACFRGISQVLEHIPAYKVQLSSNLKEIAGVLRDLVEKNIYDV